MLTREEIQTYLKALNDELTAQDAIGELCLFGGTVMCLVYQARPSTKDVDAIFVPTQTIRDAAQKVATAYDLPEDWLNDAVKGFVVPHSQRIFLDFSHLKVYIPEPDYLLAMKAMAARFDTQDAADGKIGRGATRIVADKNKSASLSGNPRPKIFIVMGVPPSCRLM